MVLITYTHSYQLEGREPDLRPEPTVSHEEVLAIGKEKAEIMQQLVEGIVDLL